LQLSLISFTAVHLTSIMPSYKLTYFGIAGAAEKVRLGFVLAGVEFEDVRIGFDAWAEMKKTTKFGQLPILSIDNGEPIAQSGAMLRYVGRLGNGSLSPQDPAAELNMNEIIGLSEDLDRTFGPCLYLAMKPDMFGLPADHAKTPEGQELVRSMRVKFVSEQLPGYLDHFARYLEASGNQFFGGNQPSIADCAILPQMSKFRAGFIDHVPTSSLDSHPTIIAWIERMHAIPAVAAWYAAPK
jgi:glutathione S-transferase